MVKHLYQFQFLNETSGLSGCLADMFHIEPQQKVHL